MSGNEISSILSQVLEERPVAEDQEILRLIKSRPPREAARELLERTQSLPPDKAFLSMREAAFLFHAEGDIQERDRALDRASALSPSVDERLRGLLEYDKGIYDLTAGKFAAASLRFSKAAKLLRGYPGALRAAGLCFIIVGNVRKAIEYFTAASAGSGKTALNSLIDLGMVYVQTGDLEMAESSFKQALNRCVEKGCRARVLLDLAALSLSRGDPHGAVQKGEEAVNILREGSEPDQLGSALYTLGASLVQAGRPSDAARALEESFRLLSSVGDPLTAEVAGLLVSLEEENMTRVTEVLRSYLPKGWALEGFLNVARSLCVKGNRRDAMKILQEVDVSAAGSEKEEEIRSGIDRTLEECSNL